MDKIDSRIIFLLLSVCVNCESNHNFNVFIDTAEDYPIPTMDCQGNGCGKIEFSLPDMKFWEVWKEDNDRGNEEKADSSTDSPHWPNPPAIWGESVMGQQPTTRPPFPYNSKLPNGPIITKLDKIVDILRPVNDPKKPIEDNWFEPESEPIVHKLKPHSRYDNSDDYYHDFDDKQLKTSKKEKSLKRRNLKKYIIEEKSEDYDNRPEVIFKKKQKKPTIVIEEELVPDIEEEVRPEDEVIYKIHKKSKPKPKTKQIIIEEEDNDYQPEVVPGVVYQKKAPKTEKIKEIYFLANGHIHETPGPQTITTTTTTPAPTVAPTLSTTSKPKSKKNKRQKILYKLEERSQSKDRDQRDTEEEEGDESSEEEVEEGEEGGGEANPDYYEEDGADVEEAWGSASPETRLQPKGHNKKQRISMNPLSVLRRLRPPYSRPPPLGPHHHHQHSTHHSYPHQQMGGTQGGMVPGGTFRMRFYMDGPKYRESEDNHDY